MADRAATDDVLYAKLAIHLGLASADAVLAASRAARNPDESFDQLLERLGTIQPAQRQSLREAAAEWSQGSDAQTLLGWTPSIESAIAAALSTAGLGQGAGDQTIPSKAADGTVQISGTLSWNSGEGAGGRQAAAGVIPAGSASRFRILRLHAKGGLGQVSRAIDEELNREIALKEIQPQYVDDLESRSRFVREAEITGRLEHPGVVPIYGFGVSPAGGPYYAMRFIEGRSLKEAIDDFFGSSSQSPRDRSLKFHELLRRMISVCHTIQYAHKHEVIHRDLKPANIMLGPYGETLVVDWGLAKSLQENETLEQRTAATRTLSGDSTATMDGSTLGTPQYMSPEQAEGRLADVGPLSDIYSLGATLYHLLTGQTPFTAKSLGELLSKVVRGDFARPRSVRKTVPAALESVCLKAMAREPANRYQSALEIGQEIERYLADEPVLAYREALVERWYRLARRHRAWVLGVATMLPLLALVMSLAAFFVNQQRVEAVNQRDLALQAKRDESVQRRLAQTNEAKAIANEQRAIAEENKAKLAAADAGRSLARLLLSNGERLESQGDLSGAALWYSRALPLMQAYQPELEATHRLRLGMTLRQLPRPARMVSLPPEQRRLVVQQTLSPDGGLVAWSGAMNAIFVVSSQTGEAPYPPLDHKSIVLACKFTADNQRLVSLSIQNEVQIWDVAKGTPLTPVIVPTGKVSWTRAGADGPIDLSPDGKWLAVMTSHAGKHQIEFLDVANLREARPPLVLENEPLCLQFHPQSTELVVASASSVQRLAVGTFEPVAPPTNVSGLWLTRYSPDGKWIIFASSTGYARLWDAELKAAVGNPMNHVGPVTNAIFSPDGSTLATLSADRTARLWKIPSGDSLGLSMEHAERALNARFHPDGSKLLTISLDHIVRVWDAGTGRRVGAPFFHGSAIDAAFVDDEVRIAGNGAVIAWNPEDSQNPARVDLRPPTPAARLTFLPENRLAIFGAAQIFLSDLAGKSSEQTVLEAGEEIVVSAASDNGRWLATAGKSGKLKLHDTASLGGQDFDPELKGEVAHLKFSRSGEWLLAADAMGGGRILDTATAKWLDAITHDQAIRDSDFSSDGRLVVTASDDQQIRIWEVQTGKLVAGPQLADARKPASAVSQVRFHPGGRAVLAGTDFGTVLVWEYQAMPAKFHRIRLGAAVTTVEFAPDGRLVLGAGYANAVKVWDWNRDPQLPSELPAGLMSMTARFQPGTENVVTSSFGGTALWEARSGRRLGPTLQPISRGVAFSGDGDRLATIDGDIVHVWNITPAHQSPAEIESLARLRATREIDANGTLRFLTVDEIQTALDPTPPGP